MKKLDNLTNITCPYCGSKPGDHRDEFNGPDDSIEIWCEECEKTYDACINVLITYTTIGEE